MLSEHITLDSISETTTHKDVKKIIKSLHNYKLVGSKTERKGIIKEYLEEMKKIQSQRKRYELELGDLTGKKKKLVEMIAEDEFKDMMKEKIMTEISWEEAENKFASDPRWKNDNINYEQKKEMFMEFIFEMRQRKKRAYKQLLNEKIGLNQEMTWHDAQHLMQGDSRYREVLEKDRELMYTEHMAWVQEKVLEEFTSFLNETQLINQDSSIEGPQFRDLINKMNQDIRCQRVSKHPDKRDKLVRAKIKNMKFQFEKKQREEKRMNVRQKYQEEEEKFSGNKRDREKEDKDYKHRDRNDRDKDREKDKDKYRDRNNTRNHKEDRRRDIK